MAVAPDAGGAAAPYRSPPGAAPTAPVASVIECVDLVHSFGKKEVLRGVSFHVPKGSVYGLMDKSEDRSLPLKRWTVVALVAGAGVVAVGATAACRRDRDSLAEGAMVLTTGLAVALLLAFAAEPISPTRRMRESPQSALARVLYPRGLAPSILFVVFWSAFGLLAAPLLAVASPRFWVHGLWMVTFLAALGGVTGSIASRRGAAAARRVAGGLVVGLTLLVTIVRGRTNGASWVDLLCPLWLDSDDVRNEGALGVALVAWAGLAIVSVSAMFRSVHLRTLRDRCRSKGTT